MTRLSEKYQAMKDYLWRRWIEEQHPEIKKVPWKVGK